MAAKRTPPKTPAPADPVLENETDPEVPAVNDPQPPPHPLHGDKDPAFVQWLFRTDPEAFRARYVGRGGDLVTSLYATLPPQPTTNQQ